LLVIVLSVLLNVQPSVPVFELLLVCTAPSFRFSFCAGHVA